MVHEKKDNAKNSSDAPKKQPASGNKIEVLKKCRCNSENFHTVGEYYIVDEERDDEISNRVILKKAAKKRDEATAEEKQKDND